jgi:hypothetical protein
MSEIPAGWGRSSRQAWATYQDSETLLEWYVWVLSSGEVYALATRYKMGYVRNMPKYTEWPEGQALSSNQEYQRKSSEQVFVCKGGRGNKH